MGRARTERGVMVAGIRADVVPHGVSRPLPDDVGLSPGRISPAALDVFGAECVADRVAYYAARAGLRLPLFADLPAVPREPKKVTCWACAATCNWREFLADGASGWQSRRCGSEAEVYCPCCFDAHGWPGAEDDGDE